MGAAVHQYFIAAGSATLTLTRVTGKPDQLAYHHTEALGSPDAVNQVMWAHPA